MLKQRLLMAAHGSSGAATTLYSFGTNVNGTSAQNTATGTTLAPTATIDTHNTWTKIAANSVDSSAAGTMCFGLLSNGTLWSWGNNHKAGSNTGTAGQGANNNNYLVPTQITGASNWTDISSNRYGGVAIKSDGTAWSFGVDTYGQLGQGASGTIYPTPTQIGSATNWAKVFSGYWATFMIDTSGKLYAMGNNDSYLTGLGIISGNTGTPTQVGSATNWVFVAVGLYGAIGIQSNGTAWSWGTDFNGELCQGSTGGVYSTPTQIGSGTNWVLAATDCIGGFFSFLIQDVAGSRTLWTAGNNAKYATGRGTNSGNTTTLTQVGSAVDWADIACLNDNTAAGSAALGLRTTGQVFSWGDNSYGKTGQGTSTGTTNTPTRIGTDVWSKISVSKSGPIAFLIK